MKIELEDDAPLLIVRALEHYAAYLKATDRDESRYLAIADSLKRKPAGSEQPEETKRKRKA